MAFPTLSKNPKAIAKRRVYNTIASSPEAGKVITRKRWTKEMYEFDVEYTPINASDLALLKAHEASVGCHTVFAWTHCTESVSYNVRYKEPIRFFESTDYGDLSPVSFTLLST